MNSSSTNRQALVAAARARHRRVCAFCGGSPSDSHAAEWGAFYRCACGDPACGVPALIALTDRYAATLAWIGRQGQAPKAAAAASEALSEPVPES